MAEVLTALIWGGIGFQHYSQKIEEHTNPPLGRMVEINNHRHLRVIEHGQRRGPSIVLEAGGICTASFWQLVQPKLPKEYYCISYDRAGFGWSPSRNTPYKMIDDIEDLHCLLMKLNAPQPYILVGHSYGGPLVQMYAHQYPQEVQGIVFVESTHEDLLDKKLAGGILSFPTSLLKAITFSNFIGIPRLLWLLFATKKLEHLPQEMQEQMKTEVLKQSHMDASYEVIMHLADSLRQIKNLPVSEKPLVVISAGDFPPTCPSEIIKGIKELQENFLTKSTSTFKKYKIAEKSGHMVPFDQPEIIVEAIHDMIEDLTTSTIGDKAAEA